jgi:hypothetical protein
MRWTSRWSGGRHLDIVLQFYSSRCVDVAFSQGCTDLIVVGALAHLLNFSDDGRLVNVAFAVKVDLSACMSTEALVRRRYAKLFDRARMSSCLNCGYLRCSFRTFIVRRNLGCGAAMQQVV